MPFRFVHIRKKRRHGVTATEILERLERYIQQNEDKPMRLLVTHWKDQQDALSYREIREAIVYEGLSTDLVREWTDDYSRFVIDKLTPVWVDAMMAGSHGQPTFDKVLGEFRFNPYQSDTKIWVDDRGASFITAVTGQQQEAMRSMIRQALYEKYSYDELARIIRPCIGLTEGQSRAVMRYYDNLKANLREQHPRMKESSLEERCREKAVMYASRLHRDRAETIARTEMAFAYNHGMHESMKQASEKGLIGTLEKRWVTSGNENVCPQCDALNGTQIGFDSVFDFGKHRHLFDGQEACPPAHPRCCCVVQYIEVAPPVFEPEQVPEEPNFDTVGIMPERPKREDYGDLDKYYEARDEYRATRDQVKRMAEYYIDDYYRGIPERFSDTEEFASYLRDKGFVHQLEETLRDGTFVLDPKAMTDAASAFEIIEKKLPKVFEYTEYVELDAMRKTTNIAWTTGDGEIVLSSRFSKGSYKEVIRENVTGVIRKHFVETNHVPLHTYIHETGHNVEQQLSQMLGGRVSGNNKLWSEFAASFEVTTEQELLDRYPISGYAMTNKEEWFAEMFTAYIDGHKNPEYVRRFGEIIEKYLGG